MLKLLVPITFNLGSGYQIVATPREYDIIVNLYKDSEIIGVANFITDLVDVSCITHVEIVDDYVNSLLLSEKTVSESFFKFLIKFPSVVRKPEFRFVVDLPANLEAVANQYHFNQGRETTLENEILLRKDVILPERNKSLDGIVFTQNFNKENKEQLCELRDLLRKNAYWQGHLTLQRLRLLVASSKCFFAFHDKNIIGFSRVLSDERSFASLWDVVIDEPHRGKGVGTALMYEVFSEPTLATIKEWIIFTDTALPLYKKFGFAPEKDFPNRKMMHKLRLQETQFPHMKMLVETISRSRSPVYLNQNESLEFLFGEDGKRARLVDFWKSTLPEFTNENDVQDRKNVERSFVF